ncbi:MAG: hypothetical protein Q7T33_14760 [Dehalococcoidia bacterium]|nr:hypothetical protein [Dehalococcoidia bacterium]
MGQRWWDRPVLPYLVLAVSPVLTLPISLLILGSIPECAGDEPWWELRHFEIALLPGLADLLPLLWLASGTPGVRGAAIVAGLMGSARYAIPQAATLIYSTSYGDGECTISVFFVAAALVPVMLILWLVSALIVAVILLRARRAAGGPD